MLLFWMEQCCDLFNAALQERKDAWKKQRVSIGYNAQSKSLTEWRHEDSDGAAVPSVVQRSALRRVDLAFKAFFRRVKSGQTPGYPRFRSKKRYDSFDVPSDRAPVKGGRVQLAREFAINIAALGRSAVSTVEGCSSSKARSGQVTA